MLSESEYEKWAKGFKTVQRLFQRLAAKKSGSKATERTYSRSLMLWHEYSGLNPDKTVQKWETESKADLSQALEDWDVKLDSFVNWLSKDKGFTKNVASSIHAAVKSLIKYNCRIRLTIGTPSVGIVESLTPLTIEDFRKIDTVASIQQKWIIRGLKDSGMSREDFIELTYGDVKSDFEKGEQFIHVNVIRRKEQIKYETFLGPNAVEVLRIYLDIRRKRGETISDKTPLTVGETQPYPKLAVNSLTKTVLRLGERVGIKASPHRLRKTFETYMSLSVRHPVVLKFWMGHKLASDIEAKYIIPPEPEQRKIYMEAYKTIDLAPKPEYDELIKAEIKTRMENLNAEQRKAFVAEITTLYGARAKRWVSEKEFKDLIEMPDLNPDGAGLTDCQFEQIAETELLSYLKAGWQIVKELQNGEVIVKR